MSEAATCQRCLNDHEWPDGRERPAVIQLVGEWLCDFHYDQSVKHESTYAKTIVRREHGQA